MPEITGISEAIAANQIVMLAVLCDASFASLGATASGLYEPIITGRVFPGAAPNTGFTKSVTYGLLPSTVTGATAMPLNIPLVGLRL